jgi:hypothetical protein
MNKLAYQDIQLMSTGTTEENSQRCCLRIAIINAAFDVLKDRELLVSKMHAVSNTAHTAQPHSSQAIPLNLVP